jgi:hypothetical protein
MSLVVVVALLAWWLWRTKRVAAPTTIKEASNAVVISGNAPDATGASNSAPTNVYAHNLMLRKGSTGFRIYVRWLRGQMARTSRNVNPSFDDPESFFIDVKAGVVHTNVGDLANFLNQGITNSPLTNIKLSGDGDQLKLTGTSPFPAYSTPVIFPALRSKKMTFFWTPPKPCHRRTFADNLPACASSILTSRRFTATPRKM